MAAIARTLSSASGIQVDVQRLNIVVFCGVVLVASLLLLCWSAHLGPAPGTIELDVMNWI
jgi:hypothetical protein